MRNHRGRDQPDDRASSSSRTMSARRLLRTYLPKLQSVALRKHGTLRRSCDEYNKKLKAEGGGQRNKVIQSADAYFEPFRIACQTKHPEVVHVALNGIQNLVAGGYLTGEAMMKMADQKEMPLIDVMVKTICECCDIPHSSTQLMVINTLLTVCTCGTTEVHGDSLTMVIMSLYYVFLNSRDWDVQTSATATLTQTMSILFARIETVSQELTALQDEMKRMKAREEQKKLEEAMKAKEEEMKKRENDAERKDNDGEYVMSSDSKNNDNDSKDDAKDNDDDDASNGDLSEDDDFDNPRPVSNGEEPIEAIPLTSEDVATSILQSMINQVTAAEEEKERMKQESVTAIEVVNGVVDDLITNALQIHVERLADAYKRRGNQEYSKNHHRTALKYYQKAHDLNPRTPIYLVNMGITYYVLNELEQSHKLCVEAVKVGKENGAQIQWIAKAFSTLAHVAYKQQKIDHCIRFYRLSLSEYEDQKIQRKLNEILQEFGDATTDTNDLEFWEKVSSHSNHNDTPESTPSASRSESGSVDGRGGGGGGGKGGHGRNGVQSPRRTQQQLVSLLSKLYKDCFIVLEELCKLAAKQKVDKSLLQSNQWGSFLFPKNDNDLINIRSRSLSLRLINSAMQNVGPHLSSTKKFIQMIQTNLVPTLCANVTSTIESIIQMAMSIFKALVERFKQNLVSEIGVLFDSFLLLASSPNSTFQQKLEVLKVLSDICNDGHTTVSLFLNYDCSNQATRPKVFQHIISTVEHINNTKLESRDWINEEEANALRTAALRCYVTITRSLVQWEETRFSRGTNGNGAESGTVSPREMSSSANRLKPLSIQEANSSEKEMKGNDADDIVRTASMTNIGSNGSINSIPQTPTNEESVSISNSEMDYVAPNYHDIFTTQKKKEETFRNGVVKFNIKPSHVKYTTQSFIQIPIRKYLKIILMMFLLAIIFRNF